MELIGSILNTVLSGLLLSVGNYIPQFLGGLVVLLIGIIIASLLRSVIASLLNLIKFENWFVSLGKWLEGTPKEKKQVGIWSALIAELVRWTVVILFLIPVVEAWGLPRISQVFNQFLLYVPNVFVAVVIGFVGLVITNLVSEVVKNAAAGLGSDSSNFLSSVARWSLILFTTLIVLNQLGVAGDLIRILFTGIVAMVAIAGGVAFGLGGQAEARSFLEELRKKIEG